VDLHAAINKAQELLKITDDHCLDRHARWDGMVKLLTACAEQTGDRSSLNKVMAQRAQDLNNIQFAVKLYCRNKLDDILERKVCIQQGKKVLVYIPADNGLRGYFLDLIATLAHREWEESRAPADLSEAVVQYEAAIKFSGGSHEQRTCRIQQLIRLVGLW